MGDSADKVQHHAIDTPIASDNGSLHDDNVSVAEVRPVGEFVPRQAARRLVLVPHQDEGGAPRSAQDSDVEMSPGSLGSRRHPSHSSWIQSSSAIHGRRRYESDFPEEGKRDEVCATGCQGTFQNALRGCQQTGTSVEGILVSSTVAASSKVQRWQNWSVEWDEEASRAATRKRRNHHGDLEHRVNRAMTRIQMGS